MKLGVFGFYGGKGLINHPSPNSYGPTASTLNIISVSFSCGGSIVLMSGRDNKSDILFILYYSAVLRYQL